MKSIFSVDISPLAIEITDGKQDVNVSAIINFDGNMYLASPNYP